MIEAKPVEDAPESDEEDTAAEPGEKKTKKRKKFAEVIFKNAHQITNKKWMETKNPYQQELASKLDSATDISKLRLSRQPLETNVLAIAPNEDMKFLKVRKKIKNNFEFLYEILRVNAIPMI